MMLGCCGVLLLGALALPPFLRFIISLWRALIAPNLGLAIDLKKQGRWAVVTGATGGIGTAFVKAFAERGMDVVLVSRSLPKLEELSEEVKKSFGVQTRIVEVDLTEGQAAYSKVAKATQELEIGVVVNNAGVSYEHPEYFENMSEESLANILQLNVAAVTGIARVLLPKMLERRKGVLINVSSLASLLPSPYLSVYSASKAYINKLSEDLASEAAPKGVTVQYIVPGPVVTKMAKVKRATWMVPTPEKFVESTLKTVGIQPCTAGYLPHYAILASEHGIRYICEKFSVWLVTKTMLNVRKRALRKKKPEVEKSHGLDPNRLEPGM